MTEKLKNDTAAKPKEQKPEERKKEVFFAGSKLVSNAGTPRLKDLNLSSNFLFGEVMWDEQTGKDVLEIILGIEIDKVTIVNKEQHMDPDKTHKGIRLDVYLKDGKGTVYNIEIQVKNRYNIQKRSRHYQGVIDTKILPAGEIDYGKMNDTYIIFICMFDLFERGKYCYTFEERCLEEPDLALEDGTKKIFLNADGDNEDEVSPELVEFLKYVKNTNGSQLKSERMKRLDQRVKRVKENAEVEARFMTMLLYEKEIAMDAREEGMKEGIEKGIEKGIEQGRKEGIEKGIEKGTVLTYFNLVKDGIMTIEQAATRLDVSEDEFYEMAEGYLKEKK